MVGNIPDGMDVLRHEDECRFKIILLFFGSRRSEVVQMCFD